MSTNEEQKAEERGEEKRVKALASGALNRLGRNNCIVICPMPPSPIITNAGSFRGWTVRATDDDAHETCRVGVELDPSLSDEQIQAKIIESFSAAKWEPSKPPK